MCYCLFFEVSVSTGMIILTGFLLGYYLHLNQGDPALPSAGAEPTLNTQ